MQIDYIDPNGGDELENLCLACWNCNNHKRQAILVPDPETGQEVALFNPRTQNYVLFKNNKRAINDPFST